MDTKAKLEAAFAPKPGKSVSVTLAEPIKREGGDILWLTLSKPNAGNMRGLKVPDIVNGDVNTIIALLPRIATPQIGAHEAEALEAEDIGEIAGAIFGFFMTETDKAKMAQMMGN
jgi:hypothetical protein